MHNTKAVHTDREYPVRNHRVDIPVHCLRASAMVYSENVICFYR